MGLPTKPQATGHQPTITLARVADHQTPPEQIWVLLTRPQQKGVFQTIVQVCRSLIPAGQHAGEGSNELS